MNWLATVVMPLAGQRVTHMPMRLFLLAEFGGGHGEALLEVAGEDDAVGKAAGCGYLGDGHLGMLGEELGAVGEAHIVEEVRDAAVVAALREGSTDALF